MLKKGYSLQDIGFTGVADPDYRFLCNAHKLMLYLQELIENEMKAIGSFNEYSDYSYISDERFTKFISKHKDSFSKNIDAMIMAGDLLLYTQKKTYTYLKNCIADQDRRNDRMLRGLAGELRDLHKAYLGSETKDMDSSEPKLIIPYTSVDLGYYIFDAITKRMQGIMKEKLLSPLSTYGMSEAELKKYKEILNK
jgi:hypothetical protein